MERWDQLLELLGVHKDKLEKYCIITLPRMIETLSVTSMALQLGLETPEPGSHYIDVQEKLQKFQLQESQVLTWDINKNCLLGYIYYQVNGLAESVQSMQDSS